MISCQVSLLSFYIQCTENLLTENSVQSKREEKNAMNILRFPLVLKQLDQFSLTRMCSWQNHWQIDLKVSVLGR